ncbi:Sugar-specific transcriptional regulator TrmB [Halogranum amylolyticum]|uniref:Sugar-specific transcriptional regulator TrmB n=1 Tax=Halogranum amylolyticum TaxID=660520 RepID=A0A1H8VDX4_9EURY|nr:helix-turn-helix domain-containing protein [Halogranum amylolyticum]SEP13646.1 Sugar-specific transcriptional regulator TrmB [Halogranum amylolyticum]
MQAPLTQQSTAGENITVPAELDSPQSKLVYLYLTVEGETTIDEITTSLGMKKLSLYPTLNRLSQNGFIHQTGETYVSNYN